MINVNYGDWLLVGTLLSLSERQAKARQLAAKMFT